MSFEFSGPILLIAVILSVGLTIICNLIALVTNHWILLSSGSQSNIVNVGLWSGCFQNYFQDFTKQRINGCYAYQNNYHKIAPEWPIPYWIIVIRIFAICSLMIVILACFLTIVLLLMLTVLSNRPSGFSGRKGEIETYCGKSIFYFAPGLFFLAGIIMAITLFISGDNASQFEIEDTWKGLSELETNQSKLGHSWFFQLVSCLFSATSSGLLTWLIILKNHDEI